VNDMDGLWVSPPFPNKGRTFQKVVTTGNNANAS
jgi:hypothetical protein